MTWEIRKKGFLTRSITGEPIVCLDEEKTRVGPPIPFPRREMERDTEEDVIPGKVIRRNKRGSNFS